ncbi:hypothetical protein [uncultured Gammaproteobacteria bacterium]|nr:hypothetical protein [uncultured Gammaproteobacteria bacterium]CAC9988040.1 hypothetical protein [uncultured Gammaproteobacteria bacterium]CAC9990898.1 hypothetical protein [uncultured Gammaproteobacteria bacterium]
MLFYWQIQRIIFDALVQTRLQINKGTKTDIGMLFFSFQSMLKKPVV